MSDADAAPQTGNPRPILPPFSKPIIIAAIVLDIIVFAGFSRKGIFLALMLFFNIGVCAVAYFAILRYLEGRLFRDKGQSPSRKSSPISE